MGTGLITQKQASNTKPLLEAVTILRQRQKQLELEQQETRRVVSHLHDAVSLLANRSGISQQTLGLDKAVRAKVADVTNRTLKRDTVFQRLKELIAPLARKLFNTTDPKKASVREHFESFISVVDDFNLNEQDMDLRDFIGQCHFYVEIPSGREQVRDLISLFVDDVEEPLEPTSYNSRLFLSRFSTLVNGRPHDETSFDFTQKEMDPIDRSVKLLLRKNDISLLKDIAFREYSSQEQMDRYVPSLVYAVFLYTQVKVDNDGADLELALNTNFNKLFDLINEIASEAHNETSVGHPELDQEPSEPLKNKNLDMGNAYDLKYSAGDDYEYVMSHLNAFMKDPDPEIALDDYVKHNPALKFYTIEKPFELIANLINGIEAKRKKSGLSRALVEPLRKIYSIIFFKRMTRAEAKKLIEWIYDESPNFAEKPFLEKPFLKSDVLAFIAEPEVDELQEPIFSQAGKPLIQVLYDALKFDDSGAIIDFEYRILGPFITAVRKAQGYDVKIEAPDVDGPSSDGPQEEEAKN